MDRTVLRFFRLIILFLPGCFLVNLVEAASTPPTYVLVIEGSPALDYIGTCTFLSEAGEILHQKLKGTVPDKYSIEAPLVSCIVQKWDAWGDLVVGLVDLRTNALIAKADTNAAFNWVTVQTDGPWGNAAGLRGNQGSIILQRKHSP